MEPSIRPESMRLSALRENRPRFGPITAALVMAVAVFVSATAPVVQAADPTMDKAAALVADAIDHAKLKSVLVFDFVGPDYEVTALGRALADDFNASLEKSAVTFSVESRSQIRAAIANNQFALASENDGESTLTFARDLKVKALVMGSLSMTAHELNIVLACYRVGERKPLKAIRITSPLNEQETKLVLDDLTDDGLNGYPDAAKNGYSHPECVSCPRANYSDEAMRNNVQGVVGLEVIVTADGRVGDIHVQKPLPDGLTEAAIAAVSKWKLKPSTGPDGKPADVREVIQVQFTLESRPLL